MDMFGSFNAYCCGSCTDKKRDEVTIVLEHFPAQGGDDEVPNGTIVAAQVATDEAFPSAHFDRGAESEISASRDHSRASSVPSTGKLVQKDLAAPRVASRNSRNSNGSSTGPRSGTKDAGPGKSADVPKPGNPKAKSKAVVRLRPDPAATCEAVPKRSAADDTKLAEARKLVTEANTLFTKMQLQAAIEKYGAVMELDPKCAQAYVGRGGCRLRLEEWEEAKNDLSKALQIDPKNLFALRDRAKVYLQLEEHDLAILDFDVKLRLAPADGKALCGRGDAKLRKGDTEGAIKDLSAAEKLGYPAAKALLEKAKGG
eukprot:TRINITY_DN38967_c0_g1_i1.p1 TRINITY_DN38967_c0_g1~~TRINITY_DN38967_c0_g1_i1.p1  ORF type:complete len:314 (-),score=72.05 TRINITY_DN38967_c0_g1_i1:39-980(-)